MSPEKKLCPDVAGGDLVVNRFRRLVGHERSLYLAGEVALEAEIARFQPREDPERTAPNDLPYFVKSVE